MVDRVVMMPSRPPKTMLLMKSEPTPPWFSLASDGATSASCTLREASTSPAKNASRAADVLLAAEIATATAGEPDPPSTAAEAASRTASTTVISEEETTDGAAATAAPSVGFDARREAAAASDAAPASTALDERRELVGGALVDISTEVTDAVSEMSIVVRNTDHTQRYGESGEAGLTHELS